MVYLARTPRLVQSVFRRFIWRKRTGSNERVLHLTFDDGPVPEVTRFVLDTLAAYNAKATFFCVGDNVRKYPAIFHQLTEAGHSIGNHTFNHLNGWNTDLPTYLDNVAECAKIVRSRLFRPPYGRISPAQALALQKNYDIVMWDVLSGDFDPNISPEQCIENVLTYAQSGSIIVFHDNVKSVQKLRTVLPFVLRYFSARGYRFEALPMQLTLGSNA